MSDRRAADEGVSGWLESLRGACGTRFVARPRDNGVFVGELEKTTMAGFEQVRLRTNVGLFARRRATGCDDGDEHCYLVVQRSGQARVRQNDHEVILAPGDIGLLDSAGCCEIEPLGLVEQVSLHLPRTRVLGHLAARRRAFGKVALDSLSGRTLASLVAELIVDTQRRVASGESAALLEAVAALLAGSLDASPALASPTPSAVMQRLRAERFMREHLDDYSLTPIDVATGIGISIRHLYRLFEDGGSGISRWIRDQRLARCAADLLDPAHERVSITEIAFRWGFTDTAYFSRAFKLKHGRSPRDYRNER